MKTSMLSNASRLIDRYMHSRLIEKKITDSIGYVPDTRFVHQYVDVMQVGLLVVGL